MSLSTTCPNCGRDQDLSCAYWRGVSYETNCEGCGCEIDGFLVQQTVNWPCLRENTYRTRVFPVEAAERPSFSDRVVHLVNAAVVWLKGPMSEDLSRLSCWLNSAW
jgi:hypothetical protein